MSTPPDRPEPDRDSAGGAIVVFNRDLFFGVRIANALRTRGHAVEILGASAAVADRLGAPPLPVLVIVDLAAGPEWDRIAPAAAAAGVPILAFGPHTDVAARRAAKAAGVARLVSNGEFHQQLIALVERYARPTL